MNTKIEASYTQDEKFAKEYYSYHAYRRPAGVVITVGCILAIVSGLINALAYNDYWTLICTAFGIFMLIFRIVIVKKSIKLFLERGKEGNHGIFVSVHNTVTDNSIIVRRSQSEDGAEYELSCIAKAYRSKNYIYLITKAKLIIVFDVNDFSKGTPEELIELMHQKGIKIK